MSLGEIKSLALWAGEDSQLRDQLWSLVDCADKRTSVNCLWVLAHLDKGADFWLHKKQSEMIRRLMEDRDVTRKRLFMTLLRRQNLNAENEWVLRLLDFCLTKIPSECEPFAVRGFAIHIGFKISRQHPELLTEFERYLDLIDGRAVSPGISSALRNTRQEIKKLRK